MPDTNMDIKKNNESTSDVFEFELPKNEVEQDLEVGERGNMVIPVEVIAVKSSSYVFRKTKKASTEGIFKPESTSEMRERIGEVEDEVNPINDED